MKQLRQYHATTFIDKKTSLAHIQVESEHSLGVYDKQNDSYNDDEELSKMKNSPFFKSKNQKSNTDLLENIEYGFDSTSKDLDDNDKPVFAQEYINGDVCNHEDVTDAAIKGGEVVDGGIERATTVRFLCGPTYSLLSVNEDSTCHYIVDVTVPELCEHQYFKEEARSTKVVKCLPVNA